MSMLNPLGNRDLSPSKRGGGRGKGSGLLVLLLVLVLAGTAVATWHYLDLGASDDVATPTASCPPTVPPPTVVPPAQVKVNVYNATERRGLASAVATQLKKRGFKVGKVSNDPLKRTVTGLAEVRSSTTGADAARTVVAQVGQVVLVPDQRKDASVDLVLGATFKRLVAPATATAALTPTPTPPPKGC
jgi:hypothetical protein